MYSLSVRLGNVRVLLSVTRVSPSQPTPPGVDSYQPASEGVVQLHPLPLSHQQLVLPLRLDLHEVSTRIKAESPQVSVYVGELIAY